MRGHRKGDSGWVIAHSRYAGYGQLDACCGRKRDTHEGVIIVRGHVRQVQVRLLALGVWPVCHRVLWPRLGHVLPSVRHVVVVVHVP